MASLVDLGIDIESKEEMKEKEEGDKRSQLRVKVYIRISITSGLNTFT